MLGSTSVVAASEALQDVIIDLVHYAKPFEAHVARPVVTKVRLVAMLVVLYSGSFKSVCLCYIYPVCEAPVLSLLWT